MPPYLFDRLLNLVAPHIRRQDTQMRKSISPRDRLSVTLRFLATGESFRSLEFSTRISSSSISEIVPETCRVIFELLKADYLKTPCTSLEWQEIADHFFERWNVPNCLGALDGRHITFCAPLAEGSFYRNYKATNSIVLLGLVDAYYRFTYINVGINGRVSDGGVLRGTDLNALLHDVRNPLNIPSDKPLPEMIEPASYVILSDAAFEANEHVLKPYPYRNLTCERRIYNYRVSRGRRIVENAFGILVQIWRVLLNPIYLPVDDVQTITLACCALHNFLCSEHGASLAGFVGLNEMNSSRTDLDTNDNQCQTNRSLRRNVNVNRN